MAPAKKRSSIKKRSSPKKRSSQKKNKNKLAKGVGLGVGLTALVALAYKQGLFHKLAYNIRGNTIHQQVSPVINMEQVSPTLESQVINVEPVIQDQKLSEGKIQERYMLENISKVLRKPITELKAEGITMGELTELKRNNIEIEDVKPFVKILNK